MGWRLLDLADKTTWSPTMQGLVEKGTVAVAPYDLTLEYDHWTYGMYTREPFELPYSNFRS